MDAISLERLAVPRAGIVSRTDLLAAGWSASRIDRAVQSGGLIHVTRGVFRVAGAPWSRRAAQHAALLAAGPAACLARWTAAGLHGFAEPRPGPVHLVVPHGHRPPVGAQELLRSQRTRDLPAQDRGEVDGIALTSGARTLLDLAPTVSSRQLVELTAGALRAKACCPATLAEVMDRRTNARGRGRLRRAVDFLGDDGGATRADIEAAALHAIVTAGLPRPVVAYRARDDQGRFIAEIDLAYPDALLAIEIDGYRWHSSPARKRADEDRQNRLILAGWTVLRFAATDVRSRPGWMIAAITTVLDAGRVTA